MSWPAVDADQTLCEREYVASIVPSPTAVHLPNYSQARADFDVVRSCNSELDLQLRATRLALNWVALRLANNHDLMGDAVRHCRPQLHPSNSSITCSLTQPSAIGRYVSSRSPGFSAT